MFNKQLKFSDSARGSLLIGINTLADAVKSTFGPKGKCVAIGDFEKPLKITKDGVSVAKEVQLENPFENAGVQLVKETAVTQLDVCGDGYKN